MDFRDIYNTLTVIVIGRKESTEYGVLNKCEGTLNRLK